MIVGELTLKSAMYSDAFKDKLKKIEREGYDKTKFCSAQCTLGDICDLCWHYSFNPDLFHRYTGDGNCDIHWPKEPHEGCNNDFKCYHLGEKGNSTSNE